MKSRQFSLNTYKSLNRDSNPFKSSDFLQIGKNKMTDQNKEYMYKTWGTDRLVTDYHSLNEKTKLLREINQDEITPKKHNFDPQNEIHERIRNDQDYDDWEYGTEPIPLKEWS